jgi:hypothetical protein
MPPDREKAPATDPAEGGLLPDFVRKVVERSLDAVLNNDDERSKLVQSLIPRELVQSVGEHVDAAKREAVAMVGREMQHFLQNLNVGDELRKILTSVSFEIKTEVRFIPNEDGTLRSEVKSSAQPHVGAKAKHASGKGKSGRGKGENVRRTGKRAKPKTHKAEAEELPPVGVPAGVPIVDGELEEPAEAARGRVRTVAGDAARAGGRVVGKVATLVERVAGEVVNARGESKQ